MAVDARLVTELVPVSGYAAGRDERVVLDDVEVAAVSALMNSNLFSVMVLPELKCVS